MTFGPGHINRMRDYDTRSLYLYVRLYDEDGDEVAYPEYVPQRLNLEPVNEPDIAQNLTLEVVFPPSSQEWTVRSMAIVDTRTDVEGVLHTEDLGENVIVPAGRPFRFKRNGIKVDYSCGDDTFAGSQGVRFTLEHELVSLQQSYQVGEEIIYGNVVVNHGDESDSEVVVQIDYPVANLSFQDSTETPLSHTPGVLKFKRPKLEGFGEQWFFGLTFKAELPGTVTTKLSKISSASGKTALSDTETTVIADSPNGRLSIDIRRANQDPIFRTDIVPIEMVVTEVGGAAVENASIRFSAASSVKAESISHGGVKIAPETTIAWNGQNFTAGEQRIYTFDVVPTAEGAFTLEGLITGWNNPGSQQFPIRDSLVIETINFGEIVILTLSNEDSAPHFVNKTINMKLVLANRKSTNLDSMVVELPLPAGVEYFEGSSSETVHQFSAGSGGYVRWQVATLAGNSSWEVTFKIRPVDLDTFDLTGNVTYYTEQVDSNTVQIVVDSIAAETYMFASTYNAAGSDRYIGRATADDPNDGNQDATWYDTGVANNIAGLAIYQNRIWFASKQDLRVYSIKPDGSDLREEHTIRSAASVTQIVGREDMGLLLLMDNDESGDLTIYQHDGLTFVPLVNVEANKGSATIGDPGDHHMSVSRAGIILTAQAGIDTMWTCDTDGSNPQDFNWESDFENNPQVQLPVGLWGGHAGARNKAVLSDDGQYIFVAARSTDNDYRWYRYEWPTRDFDTFYGEEQNHPTYTMMMLMPSTGWVITTGATSISANVINRIKPEVPSFQVNIGDIDFGESACFYTEP